MAAIRSRGVPYNTGWTSSLGRHSNATTHDPFDHVEQQPLLVTSTSILTVLDGIIRVTGTQAIRQSLDCWLDTLAQDKAESVERWESGIHDSFETGTQYESLAKLSLDIACLLAKRAKGEDPSEAELDSIWSTVRDSFLDILDGQEATFSTEHGGFILPLSTWETDRYRHAVLYLWILEHDTQHDLATRIAKFDTQVWVLGGEISIMLHSPEPAPSGVMSDAAKSMPDRSPKDKPMDTIGPGIPPGQPWLDEVHTLTTGMSVRISLGQEYGVRSSSGTLSSMLVLEEGLGSGRHNPMSFAAPETCFEPHISSSTTPSRSVKTRELVLKVEAIRQWERLYRQSIKHANENNLEKAMASLQDTLHHVGECEARHTIPESSRYRIEVQGEQAMVLRRGGRYADARMLLEKSLKACTDSSMTDMRVKLHGELAVVLRTMGLLDEAEVESQRQYRAAIDSGNADEICRAIGTLGMLHYQMYLDRRDPALIQAAIKELKERVEMAENLVDQAMLLGNQEQRRGVFDRRGALSKARLRACIGYARLSLCMNEVGEPGEATEYSLQSLKLAFGTGNPNVVAMSRYFHGKALRNQERFTEGLRQFNPLGTRTPAMAFCEEPSSENRGYLQDLIDAGADLDLVDEHGYSALDYAEYSGDAKTKELILAAIERKLKSDDFVKMQLQRKRSEAELRKGYRQILQVYLRPVLLAGGGNEPRLEKGFGVLRRAYLKAREDDTHRRTFGGLKFVSYDDFAALGRLPRSNVVNDPRIHEVGGPSDEYIIFISYRWIHKDFVTMTPSPDSKENAQYGRMMRAIGKFLDKTPHVRRDRLGIWIDQACIDQENPGPGVNALPIILTQCNAMISIVDENYYTRAWCAVEVYMIQRLKESYGLHLWYVSTRTADGEEQLEEGPLHKHTFPTEQNLTYESDRAKIKFLVRQAALLGRRL